MHRDYMRSLPSVRSLNGFAGLEEYNHDTDITGSLADTVLLAGHGRPGHLADRKPERWEQRATVCAAVRAAFRAGVGCDIPVYHVVPLGSRLADLFPGGGGSRRGGAGVGIDSDEEAAWRCGASAAGCSRWQSRSSSKSRRSDRPAASTGLRMCMWIRI